MTVCLVAELARVQHASATRLNVCEFSDLQTQHLQITAPVEFIMWTDLWNNPRGHLRVVLWSEAAVVAVLLLTLILWGLLAALGDERGAAAARMLAIVGGIGLGMLQILLMHLLALQPVAVKMETESRV